MPSGACVIRYEGARGVVWRIKYRDADGVQVKETIGRESDGTTRKQAEAALRGRLVRVEQKGYRKPKPLTFGDYACGWFEQGERTAVWKPNTISVYRNAIDAHLVPAFGHHRLGEIRPRDVSVWVADTMEKPHGRFKRPLSAKFVNLLLNIACSVYNAALANELADANPFLNVRRPKVVRRRWRILEPNEVGRVLAAFDDDRARRVFLTLTLTGLRRFELTALRWRDVSFTDRTLRVVESKSEEGERLIALAPALVGALEAHYGASAFRADSNFVFAHPERGTALDSYWYAIEFRAALAAAGIDDYVRPFHDARHGALTNLAAAGASLPAIMGIAGHRSPATTKQYVNLAGVVFRDEAAALEQRMGFAVPSSGTKEPQTA